MHRSPTTGCGRISATYRTTSSDNLRDLVGAALEANLLLSSAQQNEVTKRLAGWAAILAVPTAVAGIYGMKHVCNVVRT
jgi:magnesium transporter